MKRFDNTELFFSETDAESYNEEIDIILGEKYGAVNVVGSLIESTAPTYSERVLSPEMLENEDEIKQANELFRLADNGALKQRVQH